LGTWDEGLLRARRRKSGGYQFPIVGQCGDGRKFSALAITLAMTMVSFSFAYA
jgi:hypothetical protein